MTHVYTDYGILAELYPNPKPTSELYKELRKIQKEKAITYMGGVCVDCGNTYHPVAMDFHHLKDKKYEISSILLQDWEFIKTELEKCVLLCSNCHRIRHHGGDK